MAVRPGAEPYSAPGAASDGQRPVGVLLCHGFSGSPASMRPWGEYLAAEGMAVELPRLPGHGTRWQELQLTRWEDWYGAAEACLDDLLGRCSAVFAMGLSMGAVLALRLGEQRGDDVAGVVAVNPYLHLDHPLRPFVPLLKHVVPSVGGVINDIKKPGQDEVGYDRVPVKALASFLEMGGQVKADLPRLTRPLLVCRSPQDHVASPSDAAYVLGHAGSSDVTDVVLDDSYHVATLDNDAPLIFSSSLDFVRRLAPQGAG